MASIENKLESECLLIAIEEYADEIASGLELLDHGHALADLISNRIQINKQSISQEAVNDTVYLMAVENYKESVEALAFDGPTFQPDETKPSLEKMSELVLSEEGVLGDIWIAVKKILESIWKAIKKMYVSISKFFGIEKSKIEEDLKTIDALGDLEDFGIDSKSVKNLVTKYNKTLSVYMALGYDLTSSTDFEKYNKMVIGNKWALEKKDFLIKGWEKPTPKALVTPSEFSDLGNKSASVFNNVRGFLEKNYSKPVNAHVLTSFTTNGASMITILDASKDDNVLMKLEHNALTLDPKTVSKLSKNSISKLNKKFLHNLIDARKELIAEEDNFSKNAEKVQKFIDGEYKKLVSDNADSKTIVSTNSKAIGNLLSKTANGLLRHVSVYDALTDDLIAIYKKAESTAK